MKSIDYYTIISKPDYIVYRCPKCGKENYQDFDEIDFDTDYWGDGGYIDCPLCGNEVRLKDYEYL